MPRKRTGPPPNVMPTKEYIGQIGYLKVPATVPDEPPIWCPVKVFTARFHFGRYDLVVEPVGGFGSMRASTRTIWFAEKHLNQMEERPTIL